MNSDVNNETRNGGNDDEIQVVKDTNDFTSRDEDLFAGSTEQKTITIHKTYSSP